jgi:hypothetical protein
VAGWPLSTTSNPLDGSRTANDEQRSANDEQRLVLSRRYIRLLMRVITGTDQRARFHVFEPELQRLVLE